MKRSAWDAMKDCSELLSRSIKNIIYNKFPLNSEERQNEVNLVKSIVTKRQHNVERNWESDRLIYRANRLLSGISRSSTGKPTRYILSTLMKSGTKHIEACFLSQYGLERFTPSFGFSSTFQSADIIKPVYYLESDFMLGESFLSYHLFPGKALLSDASRFDIPIFVMLRNPLQAIVSQYYYCLKHGFNSNTTLTPGEYFGPRNILNKKDVKEHLMEYTLPRSIKFVNAWMNAWSTQKEHENLNIEIFHHEDLVKKRDYFYNEMNTFIGIRKKLDEEVDIDSINQLKNHNMRKGSTNEWQEFFTREQKDSYKVRINSLMEKYPFLRELWGVDG